MDKRDEVVETSGVQKRVRKCSGDIEVDNGREEVKVSGTEETDVIAEKWGKGRG